MTNAFLQILNMSLSATWLVLAVAALRFLLKKAPKWVNVLLWGLVAFRLLCPFTLESTLSLIPSAEVVPPEIMMDATPTIHTGIEAVNSVVNPVITETFAPEPAASANPLQIWIPIAAAVWGIGMALMLLYTILSYTRLRYRVRMAIRVKGNIYLSEFVDSPFVLGILKPRIYLPYHMSDSDRHHVIAHERAHICRRDHWWKPLGFLLLSVHWFNPAMWLAYILLCRDIELACDEKVIKELGVDQRADYSQALLHCSVTHRSIAACPIAFGEVGVKQRVKNVLNYKKPAFWVILICLVIVAIVSVCFLTNPKQDTDPFGNTYRVEEITYSDARISMTYKPETCPLYRLTADKKLDILEDLDSNNWLHPGTLEEFTLTVENFDGYFTGTTQQNESICLELRKSNAQAWQVFVSPETSASGFQYLLLQENGGLYITQGRYYPDSDTHQTTITHVFKLAMDESQTDPPVTMTLEYVNRSRANLIFQYSEDLSDGEVQIPEAYTLEQLVGESWEELPRLREERDLAIVAEIDNADFDAWTLPDWSEDYGRLSDGTYRIKKDITFPTDSGSTETHSIYAEFNIGGTAEDYVTLKLEDITPTGATLYEQETVDDTMDLIYDGTEGYWLENLQDGQWTYLEPTGYVEQIFEKEKRYIHELHSSGHVELDWSNLYGELPSGTYRIAREVTYTGGPDPIVCTAYAEFTVGSDWGIDLFIDRLSEDSIIVNILTGNSLPAGEYYFAGSTLQCKERIGSWTDVIPMSNPSDDRDITNEANACELIWDDAMYQLTEGEHRVGIRIKHILPDSTEEYSTIYEYFDPSTYAWGAALDVTSVSCTDQDVFIDYRQTFTKTPPEGSLSESAMLGLQRRENNQWIDFERTYYNSDLSDTGTINLSSYFGNLSNGTYRLARYVTRHYSDSTTETRPVYAVFVIDSPAEG